MKIAEVRNLTIGSIVANKLNHYKIVNINMEEGKIVSFDLEGMYPQLNTNSVDRTVKLDSMRKYELVELAVEPEIPDVVSIISKPELPELKQSIFKKSQIITDLEKLENYFVTAVNEYEESYVYTLTNMHNNNEIMIKEELVIGKYELTTNELMKKVEEKQNKPALHANKKEAKTAKTDNDALLNALREHLEGAKKSDVCNKYGIPSYIFSRVLNFKHGRPSLRGAVYELCKKYDRLDIIKHIELYEEA